MDLNYNSMKSYKVFRHPDNILMLKWGNKVSFELVSSVVLSGLR